MSFTPKRATAKVRIYPRDEHTISRSQIDSDALKIMYRLLQHGFKAYLVGGGVRDLLLRKKPKDFDIATDATPRKIKSLFSNSRVIGRRFKLVHVYFRNQKIIEVATFRDKEDEVSAEDAAANNGSRQPTSDNRYGTEETDALRRDITINGLFYDLASFSIIDYVGGVRDLETGIIRVIGDPEARFAEDPVRMVRVVRHAARSGFGIDAACCDAIQKHHALILQSSTMRVFEELKKDLICGYLLPILRLLHSVDLLDHLLPELSLDDGRRLAEGSDLARAIARADELARSGLPPSPTVMLSLLALFMSGAFEKAEPYALDLRGNAPTEFLKVVFSKLAVPRKEKERIEEILNLWFDLGPPPYQPQRLSRALRDYAGGDLSWLLYLLGDPAISREDLEDQPEPEFHDRAPRPRFIPRGPPPEGGRQHERSRRRRRRSDQRRRGGQRDHEG